MPAAVPMSVADVRRPTDRPERHIVVLEEVGGERRLPIWIGTPEALSLVAALEEVELPRPGPTTSPRRCLPPAGGALREVRVSRLADSVFYATAVLADGSEVDARPSDALTLALVTGAPIAVEAAVLDAASASRASAPSWPPRSRRARRQRERPRRRGARAAGRAGARAGRAARAALIRDRRNVRMETTAVPLSRNRDFVLLWSGQLVSTLRRVAGARRPPPRSAHARKHAPRDRELPGDRSQRAVAPTTTAKIVTAARSDSVVESRPTPMADVATPE